jgi:hypothetical protein
VYIAEWQAAAQCHPGADAVQEAIQTTGIASLDYDDLKFSIASTVEQHNLPFVCCVWMYIVATFKPSTK